MNDLPKTTLFPSTATLKRLVLRSGTGGETHYSIRRRSDSKQIAAYLDDIAKNRMGLQTNDKHSLGVARLVLAWKGWLLKRWPLACDHNP